MSVVLYVRVPEGLKDRLEALAAVKGTTLNATVTAVLLRGLGAPERAWWVMSADGLGPALGPILSERLARELAGDRHLLISVPVEVHHRPGVSPSEPPEGGVRSAS